MASYWQFDDAGLKQGDVGNAPTYNDIFTNFMGQKYATGYDPALAMTLNAGGQGMMRSGLGAFLTPTSNNAFSAANSQIQGGAGYSDEDMLSVAKGLGLDTQGKTGRELQDLLDPQLQNYSSIGGMSAGWNGSSDPRIGNATLYQSKDGKLVPIQTQGGHLREVGSYIQENPEALIPLAIAGGGLAYGAYAGAGAGAASGAAGGSTAGAGAGSAVGAGAAGTGGTGLGGLASGLQGWYAGLPAWQAGALSGAAQGGIGAGIQGKNILQGALMGGLTGGAGAAGGQFLSGVTGLPSWASRAAVSAGLGGLSGGWKGALGSGLGSLAGTGLSEAGLPSSLAGRLGGLAGNAAAGALTAGAGGAGGGSGGVGMAGGSIGAPSSAGGAGGGLAGGWRRPSAALAAEQSYLKNSYAPIAAEANRTKLAEQLAELA